MLEAALGIALLLLLVWGAHRWQALRDRRWMPSELRRATLVCAERLFRAPGPIEVTAKVDRAYRRRDGRLVLLELKTRRMGRVYPSDVIELSAQRLAITRQTGEEVVAHAYVVVQRQDGRRTAHKAVLLDLAEVDALVARREAILAGRIRPRFACAPVLCEKCGFVKACTGAQRPGRNTPEHMDG